MNTVLFTSPATHHKKFHILIFIFRLIWYVKTPTLEWRHGNVTFDDVTINDVFTRLQFAHFNRRPDISELVEEIICPRECDHMCIESNYGPVCACREGFRLYDDLRTCVLTEGKFSFSYQTLPQTLTAERYIMSHNNLCYVTCIN